MNPVNVLPPIDATQQTKGREMVDQWSGLFMIGRKTSPPRLFSIVPALYEPVNDRCRRGRVNDVIDLTRLWIHASANDTFNDGIIDNFDA